MDPKLLKESTGVMVRLTHLCEGEERIGSISIFVPNGDRNLVDLNWSHGGRKCNQCGFVTPYVEVGKVEQ